MEVGVFMKEGRKRIIKWMIPAIILLGGALVRLIYLGSVPAGLHQDEAFVMLNARDLYYEGRDSAGLHMPVYMSSWGDGQSAMYSWMLTLLLTFTGGRWNVYLCRLPQALVSVFTLWAVYCLMRRMFNRTAGLWAMFLLAICPWHVMMSRWALDANLAPGFLIFGLLFFVKGLEEERYFLLSALFYGLSLYCYAVVWPMVPVLLMLQVAYGVIGRKIHLSKWTLLSVGILFVTALPLMLFLLINLEILPEIVLPFMTIPKTSGFRGGEVSFSFGGMVNNLKAACRLLVRQDTGSVWDVLMPWGLFYDEGRWMILAGAVLLSVWVVIKSIRKQFAYEFFLLAGVVCGIFTCMYVEARVHQVNDLFIPLVLCGAYGIWKVSSWMIRKKKMLGYLVSALVVCYYAICFGLFQRDYYTDYKSAPELYFAAGVPGSVEYALEKSRELGIREISVEKAAQWPRILLYTETLPSEYLEHVRYDVFPAPASFEKDGLHINTRVDYEHINRETIYIVYYADIDPFLEDFDIAEFYDWRVAVPR